MFIQHYNIVILLVLNKHNNHFKPVSKATHTARKTISPDTHSSSLVICNTYQCKKSQIGKDELGVNR